MTRSMTRWMLVGCMALAALGAVAVLDVGSATAEAAPSVSPFAGTYSGTLPLLGTWPAPITISDGGRITSSYSGFSRTKGSINGRVADDGSYSVTVTKTFADIPERGKATWYTSSSTSAGTMEPDGAGNIVGSEDTGGTFVWLRQ